jgi:large conductance mechanosensitive channel
MPIVGLLTGGLISQKKFVTLDGNSYADLACKGWAAVITYGNLVQAIINFIAFFIFLWCYELLKSKKKEVVVVAAPAGPTRRAINKLEIC